jgi:hypothetical protein
MKSMKSVLEGVCKFITLQFHDCMLYLLAWGNFTSPVDRYLWGLQLVVCSGLDGLSDQFSLTRRTFEEHSV